MTDVSDFIDVSDPAALEDAVARAREVLADRGCVVLPKIGRASCRERV